jgi:hypothetical protein
LVGRDGVKNGGVEGPLEVKDGSFVHAREQAVVRVWWVCSP